MIYPEPIAMDSEITLKKRRRDLASSGGQGPGDFRNPE
jgi:hypothetical protein